jgi:ABC-type multidrug transport system fused ATPase/permease subunit
MSEHLILKSLDDLQKSGVQKTCIVVAHRLATIEGADTIFVLKSGEIIERGSYESLLAHRGLFYDLVVQQINASQ